MEDTGPKYSIVIPICDRTSSLQCVLICLARQTMDSGLFEVIIADDGSKEDTLSVVRDFGDILNIKYFWHPDLGFRVGPVRNRGVALAAKSSEVIIFLDSDIIVKEDWLISYSELHEEHPEVIIFGRYDYLKPMKIYPQMVISRFDDIINNRFPTMQVTDLGIQGPDVRSFEVNKKLRTPIKNFGTAMFGGNILIPKKVFLDSGGMDEKMKGHGGEDAEFSFALIEKGYLGMFSEKPSGWHIWHFVDQKAREKTVRKNIEYLEGKHEGFKSYMFYSRPHI